MEDSNDRGRREIAAWQAGKPDNFFSSDANLQEILRMHLGEKYAAAVNHFSEVGGLSSGPMNRLAIESNLDENLPKLSSCDAFGNRTEEIQFHPAYHELGALVWGTEVLSLLSQPGNELHTGALSYLMAQNGEAGHLCPVACTAGAISLIQRAGTPAQKETYLPRLLDKNYKTRIHASQFLTEIQGGSDVGANAVIAKAVEGNPPQFRIFGEKWFCSVADAGLFVVTARTEGASAGTKGLGLFLVPRTIAGRINNFRIRRLKNKLGTRSMATAEIEFEGALAEPVGKLNEGFKNAVSLVLDTSRVHNAISACGIMRRAYLESFTFAGHRTAFGRPINQYPLVRKTLDRMKLDSTAALATTFRILAMSESNNARRIHVNINKYWTSRRCTDVVRNGIEVLGGNGTIEDFSVLPRLYRDAIVLESWEGTHNTLCLQVLRDFAQRNMHRDWLDEIRSTIETIGAAELTPHKERCASLFAELQSSIEQLLKMSEDDASLAIRSIVDRMCVLNSYVSLSVEANWGCRMNSDSEKRDLLDSLVTEYL